MPTFVMDDVQLYEFDGPSGAHQYRISLITEESVEAVWADLHCEHPLYWCRAIRSCHWLSPHRGVGARRTVTLLPGVSVVERYTHWVERNGFCQNAFTVESSTAPGLRALGERYTVQRTRGGTRLDWDFIVEPRIPQLALRYVSGAIANVTDRVLIRSLERDSRRHFHAKGVGV